MCTRKPGTGNVSSRVRVAGRDARPRGTRGPWGRLSRIGIIAFAASLVVVPSLGSTDSPGAGLDAAAERTSTDAVPSSTGLEERTVDYANGDRYRGGWQDNAPHGHGSYTWANGDRYDGEWRHGQMHGHGTYVWKEATHYTGSWRDGLRHGMGTFSWADGDRVQSQWHEGTRLVARAECLTVEKTTGGTTLWVNRCDVGVDVLWRDEGDCVSTESARWPCSWYLDAHTAASASIEGQVWWRECKSPGGLGDVVAAEKEDEAVYCVSDAGLRTLAHTRRKRQHAESSEATLEARSRLERQADRAGHHR